MNFEFQCCSVLWCSVLCWGSCDKLMADTFKMICKCNNNTIDRSITCLTANKLTNVSMFERYYNKCHIFYWDRKINSFLIYRKNIYIKLIDNFYKLFRYLFFSIKTLWANIGNGGQLTPHSDQNLPLSRYNLKSPFS